MKKKKSFIIMGVVLVVIAVIAVLAIFLGRDKKKDDGQVVYVESVSNIMGFGYFGGNRYMGVVETQETTGVDKADDKKVKEIFVKEGDVVREGDKLFEYDTDDMSLKLKQLELELTSIYNNISTLNSQIETLKKEKDQVEEVYKIEYTSQIQSLQAQINQESYNASAKELEIERQKTAIQNSIVYAPIDGVIKEINADASAPSEDYYNPGGSEQHFISIMDMGEYRVKATISEFDVGMFMVGDSVIIRSRVDDSMVWHGTVTSIDVDNPDQNNNDYYYSDMGTSVTKYPVYIALDTSDNIMLGQHVYIEFDFGQTEIKDGIWLDEFYIMQESEGAYVWVEKNGEIEKRKVELGEYDSDLWAYEITSGLSSEDYIAYPEDRIEEGMKTTHNYEDIIIDEDMYMDEDIFMDGDVYMDDDMYIDEDMFIDEDMYYDEEIGVEEAY